MALTNRTKEQQRLKELEHSDRYYYNKEADKYIVFIKHLGKNCVFPGEVHRGMLAAYSGADQRSVEEICATFNIPQFIFSEYKSIFGWSRDSLPISSEEILEDSVEESVATLVERKRFEISQKFNKQDWEATQSDANKWREFSAKVYDPFEKYLEKWKAPKYIGYKPVKERDGGKSLLVWINDLHYGNKSTQKYLSRGKAQSTDYVIEAVNSYANQIIQDVVEQRLNIDSLVISSLGDILHSANPQGTTTKGTPLRYDMLSEEMFDAAFDSLTNFIDKLSRIAPKTKVFACKGNHFGVGDSILFKALSIYFKDQKNIEFNISYAPTICFQEKGLFCVATHGAHDSIKAKLGAGNKLKMQAQSMIINSQESYKGIKERVFVAADLHHQKVEEMNDFKYVLLPSIVRSDEFADAIGAYSRPCQQTFLVDNSGIKSINNYYFD